MVLRCLTLASLRETWRCFHWRYIGQTHGEDRERERRQGKADCGKTKRWDARRSRPPFRFQRSEGIWARQSQSRFQVGVIAAVQWRADQGEEGREASRGNWMHTAAVRPPQERHTRTHTDTHTHTHAHRHRHAHTHIHIQKGRETHGCSARRRARAFAFAFGRNHQA